MYSIVLDPVLTSLKHPFHNSSFVVYENIESLLLKTIKGEDTSDESEYIKQIYNDEINITQSEMRPTFFAFFSKNYFDSFFSEIRKLPKEQHLFVPSTFHMCKLLLVNPGKKNKNLEAFQNDPSEIQRVANFAYT